MRQLRELVRLWKCFLVQLVCVRVYLLWNHERFTSCCLYGPNDSRPLAPSLAPPARCGRSASHDSICAPSAATAQSNAHISRPMLICTRAANLLCHIKNALTLEIGRDLRISLEISLEYKNLSNNNSYHIDDNNSTIDEDIISS